MSNASSTPNAAFDWPVRVYYEDTDAVGVVFYANYLRFMERGRTEWLRALGYEQDDLRSREGVLFTVRRVSIDYLIPAIFNDRLIVRSGLLNLGGATLEFEQAIIREADAAHCAQAQVKVACLDAQTLRPRRMPAELIAGISSGIGRSSAAHAE